MKSDHFVLKIVPHNILNQTLTLARGNVFLQNELIMLKIPAKRPPGLLERLVWNAAPITFHERSVSVWSHFMFPNSLFYWCRDGVSFLATESILSAQDFHWHWYYLYLSCDASPQLRVGQWPTNPHNDDVNPPSHCIGQHMGDVMRLSCEDTEDGVANWPKTSFDFKVVTQSQLHAN